MTRWVGHVALMGDSRGASRVLVGKPGRKNYVEGTEAGTDENKVGLPNNSVSCYSLAKSETRHNATKLESIFQGNLPIFYTKV